MTEEARAVDLARLCLLAMERQDNAALARLFHPDARWELAYAMDGQGDAERTLIGRQVLRFHANMFRIIETNVFSDVVIEAIGDDAALVRCRSNAVLVGGARYSNYYAVRVQAAGGRILHWLEYYDPRPAERVRALLARALGADQAGASAGASITKPS